MDFTSIYLTHHDLSILYKLSNGCVCQLYEYEANYLISLGFVSPYASGNGSEYVITPTGLRYIDFLDEQQKLSRATKKQIALNTIISIIAAIASVLALFKQ